MKKSVVIIVILIVAIGIYFIVSKNKSAVPVSNNQQVPTSQTNSEIQSEIMVSINNFAFDPSTITVKKGTKVTWTNDDNVDHTVTSDSGIALNSPILSQGQSFSYTFTDSGTFGYHCKIHSMMKGAVIVEN